MDSELRDMVMSLRVTELRALLVFAGKNKEGRTKRQLQARCLQLVKQKTPQVVLKMKELYRRNQMSRLGQRLSLTGSNSVSAGADASLTGSCLHDFFTSPARGIILLNCSDVRMKELPFYDIHSVIYVLVLPSTSPTARQEIQNFFFCLTPSQAEAMASSVEVFPGDEPQYTKIQHKVQVQLRFCALDLSPAKDQEQDDLFPEGLLVKVNGRDVALPPVIPSNRPGVAPKQLSKPLYVTNLVKFSPIAINVISVQWVSNPTKDFAMSVLIVEKVTAEELLQRVLNKGIEPADLTRDRIKEITTAEEDDLCPPTSIRVSLACPLGKIRMSYPCRATTCKHLQCFDAMLFLRMNEMKSNFMCPVCNQHLKFETLRIDGYFLDVIEELSLDAENEIELYPDGRWEPARKKLKMEIEDESDARKVPSSNEIVDLDDDDDDIEIVEEDYAGTDAPSSIKKSLPAEPVLIDLIDSSDEGD